MNIENIKTIRFKIYHLMNASTINYLTLSLQKYKEFETRHFILFFSYSILYVIFIIILRHFN